MKGFDILLAFLLLLYDELLFDNYCCYLLSEDCHCWNYNSMIITIVAVACAIIPKS